MQDEDRLKYLDDAIGRGSYGDPVMLAVAVLREYARLAVQKAEPDVVKANRDSRIADMLEGYVRDDSACVHDDLE